MPFEFYDEDANYRAQDDPPDTSPGKKSGYGGRIAGFLFLVVALLVFVYHKQLLSLIGVDSNADPDKKDNGTSGKLGSIGNEDHYLTNHFNLDPSDASVGHKVNLTSCGVGDETCADFNRVTEEHKQRNDEKVKAFLSSDDCLICVYAPWCGHCRHAVPAFVTAANELPDHKIGLINFELVNRDLFADDTHVHVTHFPFVAKKSNGTWSTLKEGVSKETVVQFASEKERAPGW